MHTIWRNVGVLPILAIALAVPILSAQQGPPHSPRGLLSVVPSALHGHADAIGNRVRLPGKERTVFIGALLNERGERNPVRITVQLPTIVILEGVRPGAPPVVFDGVNSVFANSRLEEQLLEIFSTDTAEGMLVAVKDGAAATLLGRRVLERVDGRPDQTVHRYDIFEIAGSVRSSPANPDRLKSYYFDSETGLLAKTLYLDETFSPPVMIEILFSDWQKEGGSAYPRQIERKENGHSIFSLTFSSIVALPRQDPASSTHTGLQEE